MGVQKWNWGRNSGLISEISQNRHMCIGYRNGCRINISHRQAEILSTFFLRNGYHILHFFLFFQRCGGPIQIFDLMRSNRKFRTFVISVNDCTKRNGCRFYFSKSHTIREVSAILENSHFKQNENAEYSEWYKTRCHSVYFDFGCGFHIFVWV